MSARASVSGKSKVPERLKEDWAVRAGPHGVDVFPIAADAEEFAARTGIVRSVDGVFVSWVKRAIADARERRRLTAEQLAREQETYSAFTVELYRTISHHQLGPRAIADLLETSMRAGFDKLNPKTVERLRRLGDHWPEGA